MWVNSWVCALTGPPDGDLAEDYPLAGGNPLPAVQVSAIIPNYNRHEALRRAVDSVLEQRGVEVELLVVDDASSHPPEPLYRELQSAGHRVLRAAARRGPGACRNWGARQARGRYLALLDSDDFWLPHKLARQLASLEASGLRVGQTAELWYRQERQVQPLPAHRIEGGDLFERSLRAVCVSPSAVMLERSLFMEMGGFDEELFVCEDYDLWLRVAAAERFDLLPEPLSVKLGGHADQLSKQLPAMDRFRIRALARGLKDGAFADRWSLARDELLRKAEILAKGSRKRGRDDAVLLLDALRESALRSDWPGLLALSRDLMSLWPLAPGSPWVV
jgi:glycosyltransferase involved in cell wall biosynthesis